jgi:signal transduction histidine kinase
MNKMWVRLSLGFSLMVLAAVFVVALSGIVVSWADRSGLFDDNNRFRPNPRTDQLSLDLADYYRDHGSWNGSEKIILLAQVQESVERRPDRSSVFVLADKNDQILFQPYGARTSATLKEFKSSERQPIRVDGQTVGYLGRVHGVELNPPPDGPPDFARLLGNTLLSAALIASVAGIIFGVVMSRSLTAPLNELAVAARDIGARNLSRRVAEKGTDEIIDVARAFNEMASELEQGENLRRNLLADVAHELRTPLSVLQGNLRAMLDEVYPLNLEETARLYEHTRLLSRLVNDLHELAQAEAHQLPLDLQDTNLSELASGVAETFSPAADEKEIRLVRQLEPNLPLVQVDPARISQVLQNLLANALRHTTAGGSITLTSRLAAQGVALIVADTGEGIPPEHLAHVFDRFYRTDLARSRDKGGAGLGLAIARAIVEAHHGQISVASTGVSGQGTEFTILLPVSN